MTEKPTAPLYQRVLLKMSGEAMVGQEATSVDPISPVVLDRIVHEVEAIRALGVQIAIVIGGGNFFRGESLSRVGISRITGDHMGMLGTLMNALALRDAFERAQLPVRILSAIPMSGVVDHFSRRKAIHHLAEGRIVIFAAGTGNPLVTTDSAASLRGIEIDADIVIKATNVDGIYSADPHKDESAVLYRSLTYQSVLEDELAVMDLAAFCQCRDHGMPIRVLNVHKPGSLLRAMTSGEEGTLVSSEEELMA